MKIEVTREDIEHGYRSSACYCPVARALRRTFDKAAVGVTGIRINGKNYDHPSEVSTFIKRFDAEEFVQPFSFELEIV